MCHMGLQVQGQHCSIYAADISVKKKKILTSKHNYFSKLYSLQTGQTVAFWQARLRFIHRTETDLL